MWAAFNEENTHGGVEDRKDRARFGRLIHGLGAVRNVSEHLFLAFGSLPLLQYQPISSMSMPIQLLPTVRRDLCGFNTKVVEILVQ